MKCEGFEGPCDNENAERYRMNTRFEKSERNFSVHCSECRKWSESMWKDMWKDYYNGCM